MIRILSGLILSFTLIHLTGCRNPSSTEESDWIDLSHEFSNDTIYWPTAESFHLEVVSSEVTEKGYFYAANNFCAAEHGGTHLDSPIHFSEGRMTVEEIPLDRLIGDGILIDVSPRALKNADYQVSIEDLKEWEASVVRQADRTLSSFL